MFFSAKNMKPIYVFVAFVLLFAGLAVADGWSAEWQWILEGFANYVPLEEDEQLGNIKLENDVIVSDIYR